MGKAERDLLVLKYTPSVLSISKSVIPLRLIVFLKHSSTPKHSWVVQILLKVLQQRWRKSFTLSISPRKIWSLPLIFIFFSKSLPRLFFLFSFTTCYLNLLTFLFLPYISQDLQIPLPPLECWKFQLCLRHCPQVAPHITWHSEK